MAGDSTAVVAQAEAAATEAEVQAQLAYQLTLRILQDGQFELLPELTLMVAHSIQEGLAAYNAVAPAAQAAQARVQALYTHYETLLRGQT